MAENEQDESSFDIAFGDETQVVEIAKADGTTEMYFTVKCPTDITNVEITVAHK